MGKRELLLIAVFVALGVVVYQVSAPRTTGRTFSLADLARRAIRQVQSERYNAVHTSQTTHPVPASVGELRIRSVQGLTLVGEAREDLAIELSVSSTGVDQAEAERLASAASLKVDAAGDALAISVDYPQEGRQQAQMTVRMPSRLRAWLESVRGPIRASGIAGVHLVSTRAETTLTNIAEVVEGDHRAGRLEITDAGRVQLTVRSVDLKLQRIAGLTKLDLTGGELRATELRGELQIDARSTDIDVNRVDGPVRVNAVGGSITLGGLRQSVRCDGQRTDVRIALAAPAAVTAFTTGGILEFIGPPRGGVTIDAAASGGNLLVTGADLAVKTEGTTRRAAGPIGQGGPVVTLRATDATMTIRVGSAP
jgi:hypothetical protein